MYKILVIDNENLICDTCRIALDNLGYEVLCANEKDAVKIARQGDFDLAVVNRLFQEKQGCDAFEQIKQFTPSLAGVLLAEQVSSDIVLDAMKIGFSRVCKKPLDAKELVEAVQETLNLSGLRQDVIRMKTLLPLYKLIKKFIAAESEQAIYEELVEAISQAFKVPSLSVMMFDIKSNCLKIVASQGLVGSYVEDLQIKSGELIAGKVFQSKRPIILNKSSQHLSPYLALLNRKDLTAAISFPIISKGKILGVVNVSETKSDIQFSEADVEMLSIIVDQAMLALENIRSINEREENSRIRALLEQYVSPEVSSMLVKNKQNPLDIGSVQELTVLFADIRNFTSLVQHLEPSELRIFLNSFFHMFADIVFCHQGMLDKFMGDAALVIFGAPVKIDNPNEAAVSAARQIMTRFSDLRILWEKKNKIFEKVGLGIGISRGKMFLGNVGSAKRLDYTVIGSDVNIAQRLASETKFGEILITDRVQVTLGGNFPFSSEKSMLLRGMESKITVYSLSEIEI